MKPTLVCVLALLGAASLGAADGPMQPSQVCEVLEDLSAYSGKAVAVLGRFSFRGGKRFLSEQSCDGKTADGPATAALRVIFNPSEGPKPPQVFEIGSAVAYRKLHLIQKHTSLGKFRFGTQDFDRWAVVYGRIVTGRPAEPAKNEFGPVTTDLVCRGDGVVMYLQDDER
jgi:hypothetical protein